MMHEVGLGLAMRTPVKEKAIGMVQNFGAIVPLLRGLAPQAVHTSNTAYAAVLLTRYRFSARALPLFGNISVGGERGDEWLFPMLREAGVPLDNSRRSTVLAWGDFWRYPRRDAHGISGR